MTATGPRGAALAACNLQQTSISCAPSRLYGSVTAKAEFLHRLPCVSEPCPDQERCVVCVRVWLHACVCKRVWVCVCICVFVFVALFMLFSWMLLWVCQGRGRVFIRTKSSCFCSSESGIFCGNQLRGT